MWPEEAWIAVGMTYLQYGAELPGGKDNVVVDRLAEAFADLEISANSIKCRLANFAYRDPRSRHSGMPGGTDDNKYYEILLLPKRNPSLCQHWLRRLKRERPLLRSVLPSTMHKLVGP